MQPMQHVRIDGFGSAGIVRDIPQSQYTMQMLHNAVNVRIEDGQLSTIPANVQAQTLDKDPVFAHPFFASDESGGHIIVYSDNTIQYIDSGSNKRWITPSTPPSQNDKNYWYATQVNDILCLTNGIDAPWQITQEELKGVGTLSTMAHWPPTYVCDFFEPLKGYLIAGGISIDNIYRKGLVKWTHPMAPGDDEFFWDHTDPTLLAGENELSVKGRDVRALQPLRDQMIIYLDQEVWSMREVGGSYVFAFNLIFRDDGIVGPHAWCEVDGRAIVVGFRDIYIHDGHQRQSLSDAKIGRWFYRYARITDEMQVFYYPERQEVYILHKTNDGYREFDKALIYNVQSSAFTTMALPGADGSGGGQRMYMGLSFGANISPTSDTWDEAEGTWADSEARIPWNKPQIEYDQKLLPFLLSRGSKELLQMDSDEGGVPHGAAKIYVDVIMQALWDVFPTAGDKIKYVSRLYPRMKGVGAVGFAIGVIDTIGGSIEWKPWQDFFIHGDEAQGIPRDNAVDVRGAGRFLNFRLQMGTTRWAAFTLEGLDLELYLPQAGRR